MLSKQIHDDVLQQTDAWDDLEPYLNEAVQKAAIEPT
jgi:hypothetical protein